MDNDKQKETQEFLYNIICDNCGTIITVKAKTLKEAEEKSAKIKCCNQ